MPFSPSEEQGHKGIDLGLRTPPVLRGEGVKGKRFDTGFARGLEERGEDRDARAVSGGPGEPASFRPAAVAVHDDGDVPGQVLPVYGGQDATLRSLGESIGLPFRESFSGRVQQDSDLKELGFFVREGFVDAPDVLVGHLLELGLGPTLVVLGVSPIFISSFRSRISSR